MVRKFWEPQLGVLELAAPDAKPVLQEGRKDAACRCRVISKSPAEGPDQRPLHLRGADRGRGTGTRAGGNKREAEQAAAWPCCCAKACGRRPKVVDAAETDTRCGSSPHRRAE